jgi:arsenite methyltransferase
MCALSLVADTPALAAHYERYSVDRQFKAGQLLIERLNIQSAEQVLDVGCGTGLLAAHVAQLVGPAGNVIGVDPLPLRIQIAKQKAAANLSFKVGDANGLHEFAEHSFDVVYLNAVFHWLPEKLRPLANFQRVLKPRGRLGIATASREHPNAIQQVLGREPYNQYPEAGVPHRVSRDQLRHLLEAAGFRLQSLGLESVASLHASPEAVIEHALASSFGNFLKHLPPELRAAAQRDIVAELERTRTPEGIRQETQRLVTVAIKV